MKWSKLNYLPLFSTLAYTFSKHAWQAAKGHFTTNSSILILFNLSYYPSTVFDFQSHKWLFKNEDVAGKRNVWNMGTKYQYSWQNRPLATARCALCTLTRPVLSAVTFVSPVFCYFSRTLTCNLHVAYGAKSCAPQYSNKLVISFLWLRIYHVFLNWQFTCQLFLCLISPDHHLLCAESRQLSGQHQLPLSLCNPSAPVCWAQHEVDPVKCILYYKGKNSCGSWLIYGI